MQRPPSRRNGRKPCRRCAGEQFQKERFNRIIGMMAERNPVRLRFVSNPLKEGVTAGTRLHLPRTFARRDNHLLRMEGNCQCRTLPLTELLFFIRLRAETMVEMRRGKSQACRGSQPGEGMEQRGGICPA